MDPVKVEILPSLPTRERGLKPPNDAAAMPPLLVAPYAGAWIETEGVMCMQIGFTVAPYAGAWIETIMFMC